MLSFLKLQSKIKHADWPYIIQILFLFVLLSAVSIAFLEDFLLLFSLLFFTVFSIILTIFHQYHQQKEGLEYQHYKIQAIGELQSLLPFRAPIPPMNGWAATPELAVTVLKEIIRNKPNTIVELGSGVTTLINGYALEKYHPEGRVLSIDHDADYADVTKNELKLHGLDKFVEIRIAPLSETEINGSIQIWYDLSSINFETKIDLLIVDGPPVKTEQMARYPALPLLKDHLSEKCTIIIHDTKRKQEEAIVNRWLREYPSFNIIKLRTDKGISILTR